MRFTRLHVAILFLAVGGLTLAGHDLTLASSAASATQNIHKAKRAAPPRTVEEARRLVRQSVARLARDYSRHRAEAICHGLTVTARKSLGGSSRCAATVRLVTRSEPIAKVTVTRVALRSERRRAIVSAYLNRNRKERLVVAFAWEDGHYLLDHSVSAYRGLLG